MSRDAIASREGGAHPRVEQLEARQLLASINLADGVLTLAGTVNAQNLITVNKYGTSSIEAKVGSLRKVVSLSSVNKVVVYGQNWNDTIRVGSTMTKPMFVDMRGGNDYFSGGGGYDTVWGDAGNDSMYGNAGNDYLNGEDGNDYVNGGAGTDALSGGSGTNSVSGGETSKPPTTTTPTPSTSPRTVTAFTLYNADTNKAIQTINNGATLDLAKLPARLTIVAQTSGTVKSVKFAYDAKTSYRIENAAPWAIGGEYSVSDLAPWTGMPTSGTHKLTATPYSATKATGTAGTAKTISFTVTRSGTTTNPTTPKPPSPPPPPPPSTGGIVPRDNTAAAPNAVIASIDTTINAGQAAHVHALNSQLNDGTPITARYVWDFGDSGSKYNILSGFNAAHVYDRPGTYTVTLTLTNEAGKTDTVTKTITVQAENRKKIYVSADGSDGNDGLSTSKPLKTFAKAMSKLTDNTEILFNSGDTFNVAKGHIFVKSNVVIGSYGTGAKPLLRFTGPYESGSNILTPGGGSNGVSIENLRFDSSYTVYQSMPGAIAVGGTGVTIKNCEFGNLSDAINGARKPIGLLVQDNYAGTTLRGYFAWVQGSDHVYLGNTVGDSQLQHVLRTAGADRIFIAYNNFTNLGTTVIKGTLNIHKGNYVYMANNTLTQGTLAMGPLGGGDGLGDKGARLKWVVAENNTVNAQTNVEHGAEHVMLRNNVFKQPNGYCINVIGYNATYGRGVVDLTVVNNTGLNDGSSGNFLHVGGNANGIALVNNLYLAKNLFTGSSGSAAVYVADSDLGSFSKITNNMWCMPKIGIYAQGGINYVWPDWSNASGYKTPAEWNAYGVVGTDYFENPSTSNNAPTSGNGANGGIAWGGVFTDKNGEVRSASGSWSIGANEN